MIYTIRYIINQRRKPLHITKTKFCISSISQKLYIIIAKVCNLQLMIYTLRVMIYAFGDDIPLLSQWIKKRPAEASRFIGWGIGIRTPTNRVRVCRATVTLFPNVTRIWATDIYYTQLFEKVNTFIEKISKNF